MDTNQNTMPAMGQRVEYTRTAGSWSGHLASGYVVGFRTAYPSDNEPTGVMVELGQNPGREDNWSLDVVGLSRVRS